MGKAKMQKLRDTFGNGPNINNTTDIVKDTIHRNRAIFKMKHRRVRLLKNLRRDIRDYAAKKRKAIKMVAFGYWKEWFKEGKIGMEEEGEPNLLHS